MPDTASRWLTLSSLGLSVEIHPWACAPYVTLWLRIWCPLSWQLPAAPPTIGNSTGARGEGLADSQGFIEEPCQKAGMRRVAQVDRAGLGVTLALLP